MDFSSVKNAPTVVRIHLASASPHNRPGKHGAAAMAAVMIGRVRFTHRPMLGFYIVMALFLAISSAYWLGTSRRNATDEARP